MGSLSLPPVSTITVRAKKMAAEGDDVCIMSAEEPDFETPNQIKGAAIEAIAMGETKGLPMSGFQFLKNDIADKLMRENYIHTAPEQIIIAPGTRFSIFSTIAALCGPGDEVILPAPYWICYPEIIKASGATVKIIECSPEDNFEISPDKLNAAVTEKTKLLILNNPRNPAGTVYQRKTLAKIAEIAVSENIMVLADEIYEKWIYNRDCAHVSIASLSQEINDLTVTVNGFDNTYAMTGWRLGYLSAPLWLAKRISALQYCATANPATFVQYGAHTAMRTGKDRIEKMRLTLSKRCELLSDRLGNIEGLKFFKPSGTFYALCDIARFEISSSEFCTGLLDKMKVAVFPGAPLGAEGYIRISFAISEETIKKGAEKIRSFCKELLLRK